jgi:hypothetical protein
MFTSFPATFISHITKCYENIIPELFALLLSYLELPLILSAKGTLKCLVDAKEAKKICISR